MSFPGRGCPFDVKNLSLEYCSKEKVGRGGYRILKQLLCGGFFFSDGHLKHR